MYIYKDFIHRLRRMCLDEVYLVLQDNIPPKLSTYIQLIQDTKFEDGSYNTFYGDVKKIIHSFMTYYMETIDEIVKEADRCINMINKEELMSLMNRTISIHQMNQIGFAKVYLPITSPNDMEIYEAIEQQYNAYMQKLFEMQEKIEKLNNQDKIDAYAKDHIQRTVKNSSEMFIFAQTYLSMMLADRLYQIRVSLEEILIRMRNNLLRVQKERDDKVNALLGELYEKNKEHLTISRRDRLSSVETTEVNRGLEIIRQKIENYEDNVYLGRLEEEVAYWERRMKEFQETANLLVKLKNEQDNVTKQEEIYSNMRSTELPGTKYKCWETMGINFKDRKEYLKEKIIDAAKVLLTFFTSRGNDRLTYTDKVGSYYVDEYNHQVYSYNMGNYHFNCAGQFHEVDENATYFFDEAGRYIYENGEKIYQCAPCTSRYKLADDGRLKKVTKDCGHSERVNEECGFHIKDPNDVELLPMTDLVDIKRTLDKEVVKYLWDSFGGLLPEALHDVGTSKPKNPIHQLAHKLLKHKYSKTINEVHQKTNEAATYRDNVYKERKDKAVAASKAWKAKQVKRRKPEESDDTRERAVYNFQVAQQEFNNSLNYYYD